MSKHTTKHTTRLSKAAQKQMQKHYRKKRSADTSIKDFRAGAHWVLAEMKRMGKDDENRVIEDDIYWLLGILRDRIKERV